MATNFTVVDPDAFKTMQTDAGVLLKSFNPTTPTIADDAIVTATTGGVNPVCTPTYSDWGEDIDNCPTKTKEFNHLDGWECTLATTALQTNEDVIKLALGAADVDSTTHKIVPRAKVKLTDYSDLWWVGDLVGGGFIAIKLKNALSSGGFSLQTTKNGKGQIALTFTGFVSISAQTEMPMEIYVYDTPTSSIVSEE